MIPSGSQASARRPRPVRSGPGAVAALLAGLVALGGCFEAPNGKREFVREVLDERAQDVGPGTRGRIARALLEAERRYEVDSLLLLAVIERESTFRPRARSRRGAMGLMQLRPATAREVADRIGLDFRDDRDLFEPRLNVRLGAAYLAELKRRHESWEAALAAYNFGPSRLRSLRSGGARPGGRYSRRVMDRYGELRDAWTSLRD